MKILINTPHLDILGGVANHYAGLKNYWTTKVVYNQIGKKQATGNGLYNLPFDIYKYSKSIFSFKPDIILLNPSLGKTAIARDLIFLRIAKLLNKKVSVFFHGFNKDSIPLLNIPNLTSQLNRCECIFVLANEFRENIRSWGVTVPIHLTTTKVDDKLIESFDIESKTGKIENILFLARITKEKGIFIAIDTFKQIQGKYPNLKLSVVGDGPALTEAKQICKDCQLTNVIFYGALSGDKLKKQFEEADIYLFPTFHAEGMPTSVLEAMAFGLPVISRPVGGLCDFFRNGEMGELVDSLEPLDFANTLEKFIQKKESDIKKISQHNHTYATEHFLASSVAKQIENELKKYI